MLRRWQDWTGAAAVFLITSGLTILDLIDHSVENWWDRHTFTASVVSGILVLLVTVLLVDRVISARQLKDQSQAIAAQAAIIMTQAARTTKTISSRTSAAND